MQYSERPQLRLLTNHKYLLAPIRASWGGYGLSSRQSLTVVYHLLGPALSHRDFNIMGDYI